jgi:hypothetical protein
MMQHPNDSSIPRLSETTFARSVLSIGTSRSLDALGCAFHSEIGRLIGSQSVGFYAFAQGRPRLILSRQTPEGFLRDYEARTDCGDLLVDRMQDGTRAVDGFTEIGAGGWRQSGSFDLLQRWGYNHCLGGPLYVDGRLLGIVYTASGNRDRPYGPKLRERMNILCRAGALALGSMIDTGAIAAEPQTWIANTPPLRPIADATALPPRLQDVNKEIARALGLSRHTVKDYVGSLCKRMQARNRTELARGMPREMSR